MSNRTDKARSPLWLVRRIDGTGWHIFSGKLEEVVRHMNALHRASGQTHAAREIGG